MTTLKTTVTAGLFIRGFFIREVRSFCWKHDLELHIDEDKGLLESTYRIKVSGDSSMVEALSKWIEKGVP